MGNSSPNELELFAMRPTHARLNAVVAYEAALNNYLLNNNSNQFDAAGMTECLRLAIEFNGLWPHYIPTVWELVTADRAGGLAAKVDELGGFYEGEASSTSESDSAIGVERLADE